MRHFHKTGNRLHVAPLNIDRLWSLVKTEGEGVPVIDTLAHGYTKVLGKSLCICTGNDENAP